MRSTSSWAAVTVTVLMSASFGVARGASLSSAVGGPIPVPYQPYDYPLFPSSPISTGALTDSNPLTGITQQGNNNLQQQDTGTFALFTYQIAPSANSLTVNVLGKVDFVSPYNSLFIEVLKPSDSAFHSVVFNVPAPTPTQLSVTFNSAGNNGNFETGLALSDVLDANGVLKFAVQGGNGAVGNQTGSVLTSLYEVSVTDSVPEPAAAAALIALALGACTGRPSRNRAGRGD